MKKLTLVLFIMLLLGFGYGIGEDGSFVTPAFAETVANQDGEVLRCVAFSPYVGNHNPNTVPHPSRELIRKLLNKLVHQTSFRCIMTYGVLNGLSYTFKVAQELGLKVIAIIWLGTDPSVNNRSIDRGINKAKAYPDTIIRLSCGSEVRTRHGTALDDEIIKCINCLRAAGVSQPITTIDTWWEWCNRSWPCQVNELSTHVDWIGINIFPWWENKFSGIFPCTTAAEAADFHIARLQDVMDTYPDKGVILTEFGWPAGPKGHSETNQFTGQKCGVASNANQNLVIRGTLAKLDEKGWSGVVFEASRERWKKSIEVPVGPFWGICRRIGIPLSWKCKALY